MKLTTRLKAGRKAEWVVRSGRKVVAEVNRQLVGGVKMGFVTYLKIDEPADGSSYHWRILRDAESLEEAVGLVRDALEPSAVVAEVSDRVDFIGIGMTAERAAKFANAMRRKIAEEGLQ